MKRYEVEASIHYSYIVTAESKEEAEILLTEALGANWENQCCAPDDIEHPQIEEGPIGSDILCIGAEDGSE
jgi:hypothetical protein